MNQPDAVYPAQRSQAPDERQRFYEQVAEFHAHYGEVAELYSVKSKSATASPEIFHLGVEDGPGIRLAPGALDDDTFPSIAADFVSQWSELVNPYQVELTAQSARARDRHVSRDFIQSYCGLPVGPTNQPEYTGFMSMVADRSSSTLLSVHSGLVPLLPLPKPVLEAEDVRSFLLGEAFNDGCRERVFGEDSCITSEPRQVVFLLPVESVLEYHIGYELQVRLSGCTDRAEWTVIVDAMDASTLYSLGGGCGPE